MLLTQLIVFIGLQGSGKSTYYHRHLAETHIRLNLDMLKTRYREQLLFRACLEAKQPTVIDNTNPTLPERAQYIHPPKTAGFAVLGYYFQSRVEDCKRRNAQRAQDCVIPLVDLLGTAKRLILPKREEGFDELRFVRINDEGRFVVEAWSDEIR